MHVTPTTRTITEYGLTLSEADVAELLADPCSFGEKLANTLRPKPVANGAPANRKHLTLSRSSKKAAAVKKTPKVSTAMVTCPICGKTMKRLGMHMKTHGSSSPAAAASTPSTSSNTAAAAE